MKKLSMILGGLSMTALLFMTTGCDSDDDKETCKVHTKDFGTCAAKDISVCSDNDLNSYYLYKGDKKTQAQLDAICLPPEASAAQIKAAKMELDAVTLQLMDEVKANAICK